MKEKAQKPKRLDSEYLGCTIAGCILFMQILFFWHLYGPNQLSDFISNSAAAWVQAIGSIAAIFAAYASGVRLFKRHLVKDQIAELKARRHSFDVLHEIFHNAHAVDGMSSCISLVPEIIRGARAAAEDSLQQLSSIPPFQVPQPQQILQLNLCRQAMISYINMANAWEAKEDPEILQRWQSFAAQAVKTSNTAIENCKFHSEKLAKKIDLLELNLHE